MEPVERRDVVPVLRGPQTPPQPTAEARALSWERLEASGGGGSVWRLEGLAVPLLFRAEFAFAGQTC